MKSQYSKEIKIGAAVLIALVALIFGINYLKGVNLFKATNYYFVSYTNVTGLAQSAPVTLNGFKVGLVRSIEYDYDNPGHVIVELSLDHKLRIVEGSKAVIVTDMLGTSTIDLQMAQGSNYYEVGARLVGTEGSGLMDKVGNELMPTIMEIAPHIDSLIVSLTRVAADPALLNAVKRLDVIMANLEASTNNLNRSLASVPAIVSNADGTLANIKVMSEDLTKVSSALAVISEDLKNMPLESTMENINNITANLDKATEQLNSTNSTLGLMFNDPSLYNNLNNSAAHVDSILVDLKRQPKRYIPSIKIF